MTITLEDSAKKQERLEKKRQRQLELKKIFAAINQSQAVIEFDPSGNILHANDLFLQTFGYSLAEIKGRHHRLFVDREFQNSPDYQRFWERLRQGENLPGEYRRIAKDGREVVINASYNPVTDDTGKVYKVIKFATDVTEMSRSRSDAARVSSMMEQAPINIMFADRDLKIRYLNAASIRTLKTIERFLPLSPERILGQSIDIFHRDPSRQRTLLADPRNLPHKASIQVGDQNLELLVSAILDEKQNYVGAMVTWEVVTERLRMQQKIDKNAEEERERAKEMASLLDKINTNACTLSAAAEQLTAVSTQMASNAGATSTEAIAVSAAAEQVSKNVQTVATAVSEMNISIREIAKSAANSAAVASQAVLAAAAADSKISKLGASSNEIGDVVTVIKTIASQTNLLALNATIEAARAGDAGRGFAVVAHEVKVLSKETSRATEEISQKIRSIQNDTQGAVDAIREIGQVIKQINEISTTIAGAVEEQTATATEMGRNVDEASKGVAEIAQNVARVAHAAESTTHGAGETQQAATELSQMAMNLQELGASQIK